MLTTQLLPGRTITINDQEWLYFSGTSYLGISRLEAFKESLLEGIQQYGTNFGGSRLSNMQLPVYEEAEQALARFVGAEAALTVSSGTLAGQLLVKYLQGQGQFHFAPGAHPAMWNQRPSTYEDRQQWIDTILELSNQAGEPLVLLSNSVDPLWVLLYSLDWVSQLGKERPIWLVVDDSHGLGVIGGQGEGSYKQIKVPDHVQLIVIGSLGKALGIPGGVILGKQELVNKLFANPLFGGASPVIPAYLFAFLKSQELYQRQLELLRRNIRLFTKGIGETGLFHYYEDFPLFFTAQTELAEALARHRIMISSFAYPTANDPAITRVVVNALHTEEDVQKLIDDISVYRSDSG